MTMSSVRKKKQSRSERNYDDVQRGWRHFVHFLIDEQVGLPTTSG